jgi:hypothetical protein
MSLSSIAFVLSLGGVALLIFVLNILSNVIQQWIFDKTPQPTDEKNRAQNYKEKRQQLHSQRLVSRDLITHVNAIVDAIHAYHKKRDTHEHTHSKNEKVTIIALFLAASFAFLAAVAAWGANWVFYRQWGEMHQASIDTHDQLTLAHPPRLIVTNFVIWQKNHPHHAPPLMRAGEEIEGYVWIASDGRDTATIVETLCRPFWIKGLLPMYRPYNDMVHSDIPIPETNRNPTVFKPGDLAYWPISTTVPEDYSDNMSLYILGLVFYRDRLNTRRGMVFARKYDITERRFVRATDNPDYESEE